MIHLRPPDKLVVEVHITGRYADILWEKDGVPIADPVLANHDEILVIGETGTADFGFYQVLVHSPLFTTQLFIPSSLSFIVTSPGIYVCYVLYK